MQNGKKILSKLSKMIIFNKFLFDKAIKTINDKLRDFSLLILLLV